MRSINRGGLRSWRSNVREIVQFGWWPISTHPCKTNITTGENANNKQERSELRFHSKLLIFEADMITTRPLCNIFGPEFLWKNATLLKHRSERVHEKTLFHFKWSVADVDDDLSVSWAKVMPIFVGFYCLRFCSIAVSLFFPFVSDQNWMSKWLPFGSCNWCPEFKSIFLSRRTELSLSNEAVGCYVSFLHKAPTG